jgi:hypothetical protein
MFKIVFVALLMNPTVTSMQTTVIEYTKSSVQEGESGRLTLVQDSEQFEITDQNFAEYLVDLKKVDSVSIGVLFYKFLKSVDEAEDFNYPKFTDFNYVEMPTLKKFLQDFVHDLVHNTNRYFKATELFQTYSISFSHMFFLMNNIYETNQVSLASYQDIRKNQYYQNSQSVGFLNTLNIETNSVEQVITNMKTNISHKKNEIVNTETSIIEKYNTIEAYKALLSELNKQKKDLEFLQSSLIVKQNFLASKKRIISTITKDIKDMNDNILATENSISLLQTIDSKITHVFELLNVFMYD